MRSIKTNEEELHSKNYTRRLLASFNQTRFMEKKDINEHQNLSQ